MPIVKLLRIFALALPLLFAFTHGSPNTIEIDTLEKKKSLAGDWKIQLGDDRRYAMKDFDDSGWESIRVPGNFIYYTRRQGKTSGGIVWLRKKFRVGNNITKQNIGLTLGKIAHADETYVNGSLVGRTGSFPPDAFSMKNHPRFYLIPEQCLNFGGENVIAVRVFYQAFGEIVGEPALSVYDDWQEESKNTHFLQITMPYIIISLGFPFGFIFFILFLVRKDEEYFYYVLQLLFGFFIVFDTCTYWNIYGSNAIRLKLLILGWVGLNVAHPIFLHRIYSLQRKKIEWVLWAYLIFVLFFVVVFTGTEAGQAKLFYILIATLCIGGYNISCHVSALVKKRPFAKLFSFFGICVILGAVHDGICDVNRLTGLKLGLPGCPFENNIFHFSAMVLMVGTALVLVYRFARLMYQVEDLNVNLEKKVAERTTELSNANENLVQVNAEQERSNALYEADLWMAGNVQSMILPAIPPTSGEYDVAFFFRPLTSVSGDFYDFYYDGDTFTGIGLFDVSGHGISSGLVTLLAKSIISRVFVNSKVDTLGTIMDKINKEFIDELHGADSYVTGMLLRFRNGIVEYANSGHPDLLYRPANDGRTRKAIDKDGSSIGGPFLGIQIMEKPFRSLEFELHRGDCLLLYSDCLHESVNDTGEIYVTEKIIESMDRVRDGSAHEMLDTIVKDFTDFLGSNEHLRDDLTMLFIKKIS